MDNKSVTVSQINKYINNKMKLDENLNEINVRGEISNYKTYPSGHSYFTLKDADSQIKGVMFKGYKLYQEFEPKNGMKVIINGHIEVYEKNGQYQLYAHKIIEDGLGELHIAYEKLKKKLDDEGLFDNSHKKEIPKYPKKIGVVTAKNGAAVKDIITTIRQRYPICQIIVFPTLVQGALAPSNIVSQIKHAQEFDLDVLIVGRGGGSIEDLWSFNEEIVAREIYNCQIPVISAVGHEIDFTIADLVADARAATPTAAGVLAVPDLVEIKYKFNQYKIRLDKCINNQLIEYRNKLDEISNKQIFKNPESIYDIKQMQLDELISKFDMASKNIIIKNRKKLFMLENSIIFKNPEEITKGKKDRYIKNLSKLEVLNPLLTLKRGYSISKINNKIISSAKDVESGDNIDIEFDDGIVHTKVI